MADVAFANVNKEFGSFTAVDDLNLDIQQGEFVSLLGPSGCGKTTTLRMLAGLEFPTSGEIRIGDRVVNDVAPGQRDIAMVFQSYALYPHMTVGQNIAYPLKKRGVPKAERGPMVTKTADLLHLTELLDRKPKQLSGGQQQRLCIARAIATSPEVLLMDEPCSALDPIATSQVEDLIDDLRQQFSVVIVTHSMQQAARVSQRTAFFHLGSLVEFGDTETIFTNPTDPRTESYISGRIG